MRILSLLFISIIQFQLAYAVIPIENMDEIFKDASSYVVHLRTVSGEDKEGESEEIAAQLAALKRVLKDDDATDKYIAKAYLYRAAILGIKSNLFNSRSAGKKALKAILKARKKDKESNLILIRYGEVLLKMKGKYETGNQRPNTNAMFPSNSVMKEIKEILTVFSTRSFVEIVDENIVILAKENIERDVYTEESINLFQNDLTAYYKHLDDVLPEEFK